MIGRKSKMQKALMINNFGIFIQARTGSTRLPNKMVRPFYDGKCILEIILDRFIDNGFKEKTFLLTTTSVGDDRLVEIAESKGIKYFRGQEEDVLDRFVQAAELFQIDSVIRVCADNPFLDIQSINRLIKNASSEADYYSFKLSNEKPVILNHIGIYAELVKAETLKKVHDSVHEKIYREHVTNYIHTNPDKFVVDLEKAPVGYENTDIRLTCDTEEDFKMLQEIYSTHHDLNDKLELLILEILKNEDWMRIMQSQISNYGK